MSTHPIIMGLLLCISSVVIGVYTLYFLGSWFFYLLVLVFLGGVIILIRYIRSLSANEKFQLGRFNTSMLWLAFFILYFYHLNINQRLKLTWSRSTVSGVYSHNVSIIIIFFLFRYLIVTIVCVVKLVKLERGPLVKRL